MGLRREKQAYLIYVGAKWDGVGKRPRNRALQRGFLRKGMKEKRGTLGDPGGAS